MRCSQSEDVAAIEDADDEEEEEDEEEWGGWSNHAIAVCSAALIAGALAPALKCASVKSTMSSESPADKVAAEAADEAADDEAAAEVEEADGACASGEPSAPSQCATKHEAERAIGSESAHSKSKRRSTAAGASGDDGAADNL